MTFAEISVKGDAMVFTAIGDVVGTAAIIPVGEVYGVFATKIADKIKDQLPGKK